MIEKLFMTKAKQIELMKSFISRLYFRLLRSIKVNNIFESDYCDNLSCENQFKLGQRIFVLECNIIEEIFSLKFCSKKCARHWLCIDKDINLNGQLTKEACKRIYGHQAFCE